MLKSALIALSAGALCITTTAPRALAWGEEGHRVIALIAEHYLQPGVKQKVDAMLASDTDPATGHDIAGASLWADTPAALTGHESWHVLKLSLTKPDIDAACNHHPALPAGTPASRGPAACSLDKIDQFSKELTDKATAPVEKLLALKYLLGLVADLHQPIYVSDDNNQTGEAVKVVGGGADPGTLRHYWDSDFIDFLGDDPKAIADDLADGIRQSKTYDHMSAGTPSDWAKEAFALAKDNAYGKLPAKKSDGSYELPPDYVTSAIETVRLQMAHAGVRLASVLNRAMGAP